MSAGGSRQWLLLAGVFAVGWWAGAILDRPREHWWAHGFVAIPLGLILAASQYWMARRRRASPVPESALPAAVAWCVSCLIAIGAFALAAMRNTPTQYAAAAIISTLVVLAARGSSHRSDPG